MAKSGHGAAVGVETWAQNDGSKTADQWPKDFDKLTGRWVEGHILWPGLLTNAGWPSHGLAPPQLGHTAAGIVVKPQGVAKGLVAAAGCWWDHDTLSAVCLLVEEAAGKPVVKQLYQLAKIAVPKVL